MRYICPLYTLGRTPSILQGRNYFEILQTVINFLFYDSDGNRVIQHSLEYNSLEISLTLYHYTSMYGFNYSIYICLIIYKFILHNSIQL